MAARLKYLEINQLLKSASDAFIWAAAAFGLRFVNFNWLASVAFLFLTAFLFFRPVLSARKFWVSATLLTLLVFLSPPVTLAGRPSLPGEAALALALGLVFFLVLGSKNLVFLNRLEWQTLSRLLLAAGFILILFRGAAGILSLPAFFVVFFLLSREWFNALKTEGKVSLIDPAAAALVFTELFWVISLLPVGFVAQAAFLILVLFVFEDLAFHAERRTLSRELILQDLTFFFALSFFIFGTAGWRPI
ncbi:MAG TPA: hypothetical protein VMU70_00415 [Candidatus Tyrphobacter sp.]|nr:hypothetical protein [Candidatus Tyrphobacter sp.]